ncbi:MAG: single-stranded DNA-binding protein [Chloroflexaceae bacterium]|nr:single-stranded DNA-binding protein [Chloroflexaceae bacterium]
MAGLNKIQIIGNLGRDPEMRFTPQGTAVTTFSVAVSRRWADRSGGEREETEWFRVEAWDKLADICNRYLTKGKQVYIEGRLRVRKYTDRDGIERTAVEVIANHMLMLGSKGDTPSYHDHDAPDGDYEEADASSPPRSSASSRPSSPPARNQPQPVGDDISDDDIPF